MLVMVISLPEIAIEPVESSQLAVHVRVRADEEEGTVTPDGTSITIIPDVGIGFYAVKVKP